MDNKDETPYLDDHDFNEDDFENDLDLNEKEHIVDKYEYDVKVINIFKAIIL